MKTVEEKIGNKSNSGWQVAGKMWNARHMISNNWVFYHLNGRAKIEKYGRRHRHQSRQNGKSKILQNGLTELVRWEPFGSWPLQLAIHCECDVFSKIHFSIIFSEQWAVNIEQLHIYYFFLSFSSFAARLLLNGCYLIKISLRVSVCRHFGIIRIIKVNEAERGRTEAFLIKKIKNWTHNLSFTFPLWYPKAFEKRASQTAFPLL